LKRRSLRVFIKRRPNKRTKKKKRRRKKKKNNENENENENKKKRNSDMRSAVFVTHPKNCPSDTIFFITTVPKLVLNTSY